jgi:hypothetical protein
MSVDFPTPAQATIVATLTSLFAHAPSRKAISSSRPKTSLPVTGNLAMDRLVERDSSLPEALLAAFAPLGGAWCCFRLRFAAERRLGL